jgi:hypothetical protein
MKKSDIYKNLTGDIEPYKGKIYLVCCVGVEYDYDIFSHFMNHYKELGVDEFLVIINYLDDQSEKYKSVCNVLKNYNVKEIKKYDYSYGY